MLKAILSCGPLKKNLFDLQCCRSRLDEKYFSRCGNIKLQIFFRTLCIASFLKFIS